MIEINISNTDLEIRGHSDSIICNSVSSVAQYMCSNLDLSKYVCQNGYLKAEFKNSYFSDLLVANFIRFILDLKSTKIYLIDRR